jgi:hypothetical protein
MTNRLLICYDPFDRNLCRRPCLGGNAAIGKYLRHPSSADSFDVDAAGCLLGSTNAVYACEGGNCVAKGRGISGPSPFTLGVEQLGEFSELLFSAFRSRRPGWATVTCPLSLRYRSRRALRSPPRQQAEAMAPQFLCEAT